MLNVDYVVSGTVQRARRAAHRDGRARRDAHARASSGPRRSATSWTTRSLVLDEIGNRIVASIASEIETGRAQPRHPEAAELARRLGGAPPRPVAHVPLQPAPTTSARGTSSSMAVRLDPTFARAHAGLSFTHFQNAFLGWERARAGDRARLRGRRAQPHGRRSRPGRALGDGPRAVAARRGATSRWSSSSAAVELSPNFALGHYTLAFVHAQSRRSASRHRRGRPLAPAEPVRPAAVRDARRARHGAGSAGPVRGGRRLGRQGARRGRTRTRTSWRSPPVAWRSPVGCDEARGYLAAIRQDAAALPHRRFPGRDAVPARRRETVPQGCAAHRDAIVPGQGRSVPPARAGTGSPARERRRSRPHP